jgi:hypothetical protein
MHQVKEQQDELDEIKLSITPRDQNAVENWLGGYVVKDLEPLFLLYRGLKNNHPASQPGGNPASSIQEGRLTSVDAPAPSLTSVFEMPIPAAQDQCNARKRKRSVSKCDRARLAQEQGETGPAIQYAAILSAPDNNQTLRDYWNQYKYGTESIPSLQWLEENTNKKWRRDIKLIGQEKKACASRVWWNIRVPIYNLMHYYLDILCLTEEAALQDFAKNQKETIETR